MNDLYKNYIQSFEDEKAPLPTIMNESTTLEILNTYFHTNAGSIEEMQSIGIHNIFLYTIADNKKQFDIATIRKAQQEMALKPFIWKNFYIFRDFDTGNSSVQNASLKLLEDIPDYAVIILIVQNPQRLLSTIHSRTANYFEARKEENVSELDTIVELYKNNDIKWLLGSCFEREFSKEEVLYILSNVYKYEKSQRIQLIASGIHALENTHEKPKNILEMIILTK